jgi:hypothetical protein
VKTNFKNFKSGFRGELNRFAGDACVQRARLYAERVNGVVVDLPGLKYRGLTPCVVVLRAGAPVPPRATVVYVAG